MEQSFNVSLKPENAEKKALHISFSDIFWYLFQKQRKIKKLLTQWDYVKLKNSAPQDKFIKMQR